ncbi:conserved hypothetical protein [Candidatus Zixiibacteriota bacterium]|nr:conserved hypothetical protein [candidate division Zixibacteria bacterium]
MQIALIPILGSVLDFVINNFIALAGGATTIFMALVVWFAKKYLAPYLKVESRRRYAEYIAVIADEITDDLVQRYPDNGWMKRLDEAVDKLIDVCGIDSEIAKRAVSAALSRK